jgi:outer membrane protein
MLLKKMHSRRIYILPLMLLLSLEVVAQESYSLQDLIRRTLEENYQIQIKRKQQEIAENLDTPGNAGMLPSFGIGAENSWDVQTSESRLFTGQTRGGDNALSSRFNAFVEVNWTVFDGFSMFARRDRLRKLAMLGEVETRYYLEQTVTDLAKTYHALVLEQRLLRLYRELLDISAFRLNLEERRRGVGAGSALQYHQALMDFNADSAAVVRREMQITDLSIQINRMIRRNPAALLNIDDEAFDVYELPPTTELVRRALESSRDMERAKLEEMIAEANYRLEVGNRYPQISLFGSYAYSSQRSELGLVETSHSRGAQFGFRVRFNLYDGGRQNTSVNNAMLEQESAEIFEDDTRAYIEAEMTRFASRYQALSTQHLLLGQSNEAAERSLIIAREQFQAGSINGYEFRQTQTTALMTEQQRLQLMYEMKLIEIDIDRLSGAMMERYF